MEEPPAPGTANSPLELVQLEPEPLPLRYVVRDGEEPQTVEEFLGTLSDLVRFRVVTPVSGYANSVADVLSGMQAKGYEVHETKNLWKRSRFALLKVMMTDANGQRMEVQFPTSASSEASRATDLDFQLLHTHLAAPSLRVQGFAMILQGNLDAGVRAPDTTGLPDPVDQSPAAFFRTFGGLVQGYLAELRRLDLSVFDHLVEAGFSAQVASVVHEAIEAAAGAPAQEMIYHEVTSRLRPASSNLFVVQPSTGPTLALRFDHPTKTWAFDPLTVEAILKEDFDAGEDRISAVNRSRADEVAALLGRSLPPEAQLRQLMQDGAVEVAPQARDPRRKVVLRAEQQGEDQRNLWASVDEAGNLHVDGQDLGPGTAVVSSDGEYEWFKTIAATDVPRVVELLGGRAEEDVLDLLERHYVGQGSYEMERRLRECDIPISLHVWRG